MRGPLKEQIQNAINRALKESLVGSATTNNQAAYINVGGRRRNRKKKKNKKNNGVMGSAWSTQHFQVDQPPARCRVDIPPKAKGGSPQVTKAKKTCKELKARLSPSRSVVKDVLEADNKPLIGSEAPEDDTEAGEHDNEAAEHQNEADQENFDPDNMPLSNPFKTTKGKKSKSKKGKGNDVTSADINNDVTSKDEAQAQEQTPTAASPVASDVIVTSPSDDAMTKEVTELMVDKIEGAREERENDVTSGQATSNSSEAKTDTTDAGGQDSAAILYTTETSDVTMTLGEGPQLSQSEGGVVETQPTKPDGSLPPETTGREKQSLLHDHNPEGMVCCVIL